MAALVAGFVGHGGLAPLLGVLVQNLHLVEVRGGSTGVAGAEKRIPPLRCGMTEGEVRRVLNDCLGVPAEGGLLTKAEFSGLTSVDE